MYLVINFRGRFISTTTTSNYLRCDIQVQLFALLSCYKLLTCNQCFIQNLLICLFSIFITIMVNKLLSSNRKLRCRYFNFIKKYKLIIIVQFSDQFLCIISSSIKSDCIRICLSGVCITL